MMDLLAEASAVASVNDSDAASILHLLRAHGANVGSDEAESAHAEESPSTGAARAWLREEDDLLQRLVSERRGLEANLTGGRARGASARAPPRPLDTSDWRDIAEHFEGRTAQQCARRYQKNHQAENIKGARPRIL